MKFILFLLVILIIGIKADDNIISSNNLSTKPIPVPNIDDLRYSIDMRMGQPILDSMRYPIFEDWTYHKDKMIFIEGNNYLVPDQLSVINYPVMDSYVTSQIYTSEHDLQVYLGESSSVGYHFWYLPGMFKYSEQSVQYSDQYSNYQNYMAESYNRIIYFKGSLYENLELNSNFNRSIHNLPYVYNSTTSTTFEEFFDIYGTGFMLGADFGGLMDMTSYFSSNLIYEKNVQSISNDLGLQFTLLTISSSLTSIQEEELEQLNETYNSTINLVGGYPDSFISSDWKEWATTILQNPFPISYNFVDFSCFLQGNQVGAFNEALNAYYSS